VFLEGQELTDQKTKKALKKLNKEMAELESLYDKLEISPCKNDMDLKEKDQALNELRKEIRELEKKRDRLTYTWWGEA